MSKGKEEMSREVIGDVEEKVRALFEWREAHPRATLAEIEEEAGKVRREMMGEVMGRVIELTGRGYEVEGVRCEACGGRDLAAEATSDGGSRGGVGGQGLFH